MQFYLNHSTFHDLAGFYVYCMLQELKELLDLISSCGYFEKVKKEENKSGKKTEGSNAEAEFEVVEHKDVPAADSEEVQSSLPPEVSTDNDDNDDKPAPTVQTTHVENDTINPQVGADSFRRHFH